MQNSMSNSGNFVPKWPLISGVVFMSSLVMLSPTWACEQGTWCFFKRKANSLYENFFSPGSAVKRVPGVHRGGPIEMPLLENKPILQAGKKVVYFGWIGGVENSSYDLTIKKDGKTYWEKTTTSLFAKMEQPFDIGKYEVTVSSAVEDTSTGKKVSLTPITHRLTVVKNMGCLNSSQRKSFEEYQQQPSKSSVDKITLAWWLADQSSKCWFEAYQQIAGVESLAGVENFEEFKKDFAAGIVEEEVVEN